MCRVDPPIVAAAGVCYDEGIAGATLVRANPLPWAKEVAAQPAATLVSRNSAAGIGLRSFHTKPIGRSPLCDT